MMDRDDPTDTHQPHQDASQDVASSPKQNGSDRFDHSNPLVREMLHTITAKVMLQVEPLLVELRKVIAENASPASSAEASPSKDGPASTRHHAGANGDNADHYIDDALVDWITETVITRVMSHVRPVLQDLSKLKQDKEQATGTIGGSPNSAVKGPQATQDQVMSRVMELENLIKQKISARELRFQAMTTRKPPSR